MSDQRIEELMLERATTNEINHSIEVSQSSTRDSIIAQNESSFYTDAAAYWDRIPPTLSGVLGGFDDISALDLSSSHSFLKGIFKMSSPPGHARAVDCGAGIGRITNGLLQKYFGKVDLVEQCRQFIDKAMDTFKSSNKIGEYYCIGLQNFNPPPNTYDVIWCQWVLGHLTDEDLEAFFTRMSSSLRPNGLIVVKENISQEAVELDDEDSSVTRPECLFLDIFRRAGLKVVRNIQQKNFPDTLYRVRMFCIKPKHVESGR